MGKSKKEIGPKQKESTLSDWMDIIHQQGEKSRIEREQLRKERCEFLRNYFAEDASRITDLGDTKLMNWVDGYPVLNSKFSALILANDQVMEQLWEECARRAGFDDYLRYYLKLEIPE